MGLGGHPSTGLQHWSGEIEQPPSMPTKYTLATLKSLLRRKYIQCITLPTVLNYWARYIKIAHIESKFWVTPIIESSYWTCTILNIIYFNKSLQQLIIKCLACLYAWSLWIHLLKPSCVFKKINNNIIIIVAAPVIGMYHRRWYHQNVE